MSGEESRSADDALNAAVARIRGENGAIAGAGVLVTPDRLLTCAHVVSDALGRKRHLNVAVGTTVLVDFPLADGARGQEFTAKVERWIPEEPKQCGDLAVLRLRDAVPGTCPLPMADSDDLSRRPVRVVGFPDGEPGVIWHRGELSGKSEGDWVQLSRADIRTAHVTEGFSGSPVWDEQRGAAVGIVAAAQSKHDDTQQAFGISVKSVLQKLPGLARALTQDPFRGLATFQENHEEIFFGRSDDIKKVVTALKGDHPAVILCGPSGCGKSSLTLAGVVPKMRRDKEDGPYDAVVVNAGADGTLLSGLATDLYEAVRTRRYGDPRVENVAQVEGWLADRGLVDTLNRLRGKAGGKYIVVLDQAEALLDRTEAEIDEAARLLFPRGGTGTASRLLVTLRSDFMDAALKHPRLGPLLRDSRTLPLTPMSRDQLKEVINKPLEKAPAVAYDPGLAQRILDDACGQPENLPLLGFLLRQLWDDQFAGRLRMTTYEAMHGVKGALAEHCNQAWKQCVGENEKVAAARLLRGLVRVLPGSETPLRRRVTREEAGEEAWKLARSFADRRLLVLRGGKGEPQTAELAHEMLINVWPALRKQVQEDDKFLAGRAELNHDRDRWTKQGRSGTLLPGAMQLVAIKGWLKDRESELSEEEREFLARARQRQRAYRARIRTAWTAAAMVLALIASLGTLLAYQRRVSTQREAESRSRLLASYSAEVAKQDPGQAALIAIGAYETAPTDEARNAMLRRYDQFKEAAWVLTGAEGRIRNTATSVDGTVTLVVTDNGRATLFVRQAGGRTQRLHLDLDEMAFHPLVSRDGLRIAYVSATGAFIWHDVDPTTDEPEDLLGAPHTLRAADFKDIADRMAWLSEDESFMAFGPDSGHLATIVDGRLRLWDLATERHQDVPGRMPTNHVSVWFGPDENTLVVRHAPSNTGAYDLEVVQADTGRVRELADQVAGSALYGSPTALSGDGSVLVVCDQVKQGDETGAAYRALRVADGRALNGYTYTGPNSDCGSIAVDEKGEHFAASHGNSWMIVDTRHDRRVQQAMAPSPAMVIGRLLADPRHLVVLTVADGGNALTALPLTPTDVDGSDIVVGSPRLIDGGKSLVARVRHWDRPSGETLALIDAASGQITTSVKRPESPAAPEPAAENSLTVNDVGTLVADVVGRNTILIRQIPSLRALAEITTLPPPVDSRGNVEPLTVTFLRGGDELLTLSGSRIEHWNARTGRRLSETLEARALKLSAKNPPRFGTSEKADSGFAMNSHPESGYVQIMIYGDPVLHAVRLSTGKENKALRVRLGQDVDRAFLDSSGRYAAAKTPGGMVELWSAEAGQRPSRVVGPLGPLGSNDRFTGDGFIINFSRNDGEFYVANGSSVRFQQLSDPNNFKTYDFASNQYFMAATKDGKTLLRTRSESGFGGNDGSGRLDLIHLDPELWKRHLCDAVGRDLTDDERRGLPSGLPKVICPSY
ncbi:trypsin-like peptidase domain-containing protein [Streptomyces actuosus]|uniref:Trypsin-like peptidase domain-containing protein n=1 Tax=Streptomyces actuosus TaxID=1885 RepID=A0ABS2VYX3_STRAS|nr:serine protease [Streptomyces actuosus]MBN0048201.1 trypsin-like peptidase domain-containing protein [Streptomyces actuosus]